MCSPRKLLALAAGAVLSGCADRGLTEASSTASHQASQALAGVPLDVSGDWLWSRELKLVVPDYVAEGIFGIQAEGPNTRATCSGSGTMTLIQAGSALTGQAVQTSGQCVTAGGQTFGGVAPGAPETIAEGEVNGRSLVLLWVGAGGLVPCDFHGVVTAAQGTTATAIAGSGPCIVPGHPQSPVPLEPPPGGHQTVLSWSAVRP